MTFITIPILGITLLFVGITKCVSPSDSVYKNASHFWPLDYITGIKDVVTMSEATIFGMNGVSLTGKGNAYMDLQLGRSAVRFGDYNDICLTDLGRCLSGMTMSFWLNCQALSDKSNVKILDLVTLTSDRNENLIKIIYSTNQDQDNIQFILNDGKHQNKALITVRKQHWTHIIIIFTNSRGLLVYKNGILAAKSEQSNLQLNAGKSSTLMIGTLVGLGTFEGPSILFDEMAIWFEELNNTVIKNVFLKNYGEVTLQKACEANRTSLTVKWQPLSDPYKQILQYDIIGQSSRRNISIVRPAGSKEATIANLDPDTSYNIKVVARTVSGFSFNSSTIKCSTNLTGQTSKKENGFRLIALSPHKIRLIWSSSLQGQSLSVGVSYSTAGKPAVFQLFVSKKFLNYTIINLQENTNYEFKLFLYSSRGIEKMAPKSIKTKRIIKMPTSQIRFLTAVNISWNSAVLQWQPPVGYRDPAVQYKISYKLQQLNRMFVTTRSPTKLGGLREDTEQTVYVKVGAKGLGYLDGNVSVVFRTLVRFPAPTGLTIREIQWNSATITWQPVFRSEKILYKISYYSELNSKEVVVFKGPSETQLQLKKLKPQMGYFVSLKSGNGSEFGELQTKAFFVTPDRDECVDGSNNCSANSECMNTKGSFLCRCMPSYSEENGHCLLINKHRASCSNGSARNILWLRTPHGQTTFSKCPIGTEGVAKRYCQKISKNEAKWLPADLSGCISTWMTNFAYNMRSQKQNSSYLMQTLANEYDKQTNPVGGDVQSVVDAIGNLVESQQSAQHSKKVQTSIEVTSMAKSLVQITDDLLSSKSSASWKDLPKKKQTNSASGIMQVVEDLANIYSSSVSNSTGNKSSLFITTPNTVMSVRKIVDMNDLHFEDISSDENQRNWSSVSIPSTNLQELNRSRSVYFGSFHNIGNLLGPERKDDFGSNHERVIESGAVVASNVIAASLFPPERKRFEKPVVIVHKLAKVNASTTLTCVFWKFAGNDVGFWSADGCELKSRNETHAVCHCFHLTNFAVLMTVTKAPLKMKRHHERAAYWITTICICISLASLALAFFIFCGVKALQSSRNTTHKHLVVALFLAQLLFLCGIDKTANEKVCRGIAVATHYLFLVAFTLMGQEGFVLYMMLVKVYSRNGGYGNRKMLIACWVLPIVIVAITFIVDYEAYGNKNYCWLNADDGFIWSFVGPVISIIAINIVFMLLAIRVMAVKSKKREFLSQEIWYWIKCCSMLVTILGLCWILGIFNLNDDSVPIVYVFSILNGLQGLAILIFLCLLDPRVKDLYCKYLCCTKRDKASITSRTMSATKSTLPRQSKEVNENSILRENSEKHKACRELKAVSMEYQEIVIDFSEDEVPFEV